jgi:drug/metabolite transporter (DMT)-like permease
MDGGFSIGIGDGLCMICAFLFSLHILAVDHFVQKADGVKIACIQFFVTGIISGVLMLIFETPTWSNILAAWLPILYAGCLSSGVAYTFQILGQKYTPPTVASLLMSLESFFAAVAGAVILKQIPSGREFLGCALMLAAIMVSQIPERKKAESK